MPAPLTIPDLDARTAALGRYADALERVARAEAAFQAATAGPAPKAEPSRFAERVAERDEALVPRPATGDMAAPKPPAMGEVRPGPGPGGVE